MKLSLGWWISFLSFPVLANHLFVSRDEDKLWIERLTKAAIACDQSYRKYVPDKKVRAYPNYDEGEEHLPLGTKGSYVSHTPPGSLLVVQPGRISLGWVPPEANVTGHPLKVSVEGEPEVYLKFSLPPEHFADQREHLYGMPMVWGHLQEAKPESKLADKEKAEIAAAPLEARCLHAIEPEHTEINTLIQEDLRTRLARDAIRLEQRRESAGGDDTKDPNLKADTEQMRKVLKACDLPEIWEKSPVIEQLLRKLSA